MSSPARGTRSQRRPAARARRPVAESPGTGNWAPSAWSRCWSRDRRRGGGHHRLARAGFQGAVPSYHLAAIFSAQDGDCINLASNGTVVHVVPCAGAHDAEVFGTFHLGGDTWPGATAVEQKAASGCTSRLTGYLNPQLAASNLAQSYAYPGQQAWDAGERTVVCEVRSTSGKLTGSVRSGVGKRPPLTGSMSL